MRFTKAMDRATTKAAFTVTVGGKAIAGKVSFAEGDKVLVFKPAKALPYGKKVVMEVGATALSAEGAALAKAAKGDFKTIAKTKRSSTTSIERQHAVAAAVAARSAAAAGHRSRRTTSA